MKLRVMVASFALVSPLLASACSDAPAVNNAAAVPTSAATNNPPPAGGEEDAGVITDGGGGDPEAPIDDAGVEVDGGADGGVCGPPAGDGATLSSECSSMAARKPSGGTLTPGIYDLQSFVITGTASFCGSYMPVKYEGRLDIVATNGGFTLRERVRRADGVFSLPNRAYDATTSGTNLNVRQVCGSRVSSTDWPYSITMNAGKPTITYTHELGTAVVRLSWKMR
jgi:hypothetical protein